MAASRLGRTFAALVGSQLIARVVRLAYVFVIARFIAPDAMGVYQYAFAFYLSLGIAELGQGARLAAHAASADDLPHELALSRVLLLLATGLAAAGGALYIVLDVPSGVAEPALVCLVALVARTYAFWVRNCFIAVEDASWIPRYELVFRLAEVAAGVAALTLGGGVLALCSVHSAVWAVEAAFCHRRLTTRFGALPATRGGPRALVQLARESVVFLVSSSVMPLYWQLALVILTAEIGEMHSVGQLGIAMQLLAMVAAVPMMLGMALVPAVARVRRSGGNELRALQTVVKLALLAGGVLAPLIAATAPWALEHLVGPSYREAGHSMAVIAWALAPYAAAQLAMSALNGLGHHRASAVVAVTVVGVHLAAIPLLWSAGPVVAIEWSLVIGAGVGCAVGLWALGAALEPRGHLWWIGPGALVAAAGVWLHLDLVPGAYAIASAGIVVAAFALGMIRREELQFIAARLGRASADGKRVP